ncbi:hypothetical protein LOTGIDRAFT_234874 [Lottia gigantea]|uniref:Sushi domain-containing protein n=1 Tax=Lottia gigantea TaxID=225164 RepID=V4A3T5_LOTGI|nr:hypothetical protein LOTGIDRAFT_234874 [Lottia gigantea]ESO87881.1 hypothetical protein LOTGIDRAFT_234874 [Lottia gigantea]
MQYQDCTLRTVDSSISIHGENITSGSTVLLSCNDFGHSLGGKNTITCANGTWTPDTSSLECKWSWEDLTTHEKLVLGTSISAGIFILLIIAVILIAYCCCYRRRVYDDDASFEDGYDDSSNGHVKNRNYDHYGPSMSESGRQGIYPDTYLAYQEYPEINKSYGVDNPGADLNGVEKWPCHIPRPKIVDRTYYNT